MKPLSEYVRRGPLATGQLLALARSLAERVALDHAQDVFRGDLSPASVLWDGHETVELPAEPEPPELTEEDHFLTGAEALARLGYLAPEQIAEGAPDPDPRGDVFAIGSILHEAATGEHPFADERGAEILANIDLHDPRPPGHLRRDLPIEWDGIISCCLHKQPEQRYASALDLAAQIEALARSGGTRRRDVKPRWGRIAAVLLLLGAILVVIVSALS